MRKAIVLTIPILLVILTLIFLFVDFQRDVTARTLMSRKIIKLQLPSEDKLNANQARIVELDSKAGKYSLQWIGYDGSQKSLIYERPDMVDVIVSAEVIAGEKRTYRYIYTLTNLASSGQYLSGFVIQTYASDVIPLVDPGVYVGRMASHIQEFEEGNWYRYGNNVFGSDVTPGKMSTVVLESDAPPAIVRCLVHGGPMKINGVGEEMPLVLEESLLGFDAWPSGYTIGPSEPQHDLTSNQKTLELLNSLELFSRLGWMNNSVISRYKGALDGDVNWQEISRIVNEDRNLKKITSEVVSLMVGLSPQETD